MATWYKTTDWRHAQVDPVEVEKSTAASVWVNGRRHAKRSGHECYFMTQKEAWEFLREQETRQIELLKERLHQRRSWLGQIDAALKKLDC